MNTVYYFVAQNISHRPRSRKESAALQLREHAMKFQRLNTLDNLTCDGIGLLLFQGHDATQVPAAIAPILKRALDTEAFDLKSGSLKVFPHPEANYFVAGLGNKVEDLDLDDFRTAIIKMVTAANQEKIAHLAILMPHQHIDLLETYSAITEAARFAHYQFNNYKSKPKQNTLEAIYFITDLDEEAIELGIAEGQSLALGVTAARELVNIPACDLYPETLADKAVALGAEHGFQVEVKDEAAIKALGMEAFLAVAKGSARPPRLIVMRYNGAPENSDRLGWIGKGLTYDAGGLSIKTADGMEHMKTDMGGAAAVIGAMAAVAKMQLPVNVTAVVAACENMISGEAYKPGDILNTMGGKTIYIGNTDAEGRLTLVDAITYLVRHEDVTSVVDLATLTGAALFALGNVAALTVSNDDVFNQRYEEASKQAGEKVWRMPTFKEYETLITHHEADLTNMAGKPGSITAALVLREFVEQKPWVHVDIAGVAFYSAPMGNYPKGASGYGVKTLFEMAKQA